jgi:hypothetical protein
MRKVHGLVAQAQTQPSYLYHGWSPDPTNYDRAYDDCMGKVWFVFQNKSCALLFKLAMNTVD